MINRTVPHPIPVAEAYALTAQFNAEEEDGWTYAVALDPKGGPLALVEIFDADGAHVGTL